MILSMEHEFVHVCGCEGERMSASACDRTCVELFEALEEICENVLNCFEHVFLALTFFSACELIF